MLAHAMEPNNTTEMAKLSNSDLGPCGRLSCLILTLHERRLLTNESFWYELAHELRTP